MRVQDLKIIVWYQRIFIVRCWHVIYYSVLSKQRNICQIHNRKARRCKKRLKVCDECCVKLCSPTHAFMGCCLIRCMDTFSLHSTFLILTSIYAYVFKLVSLFHVYSPWRYINLAFPSYCSSNLTVKQRNSFNTTLINTISFYKLHVSAQWFKP